MRTSNMAASPLQPLLGRTPQPRITMQRALIAAFLVVSLVSFVCLQERASDEAWKHTSVSEQRLRSGDHESSASSLRQFYKQRASSLTADQQQVVGMMKHAWDAYAKYGDHADMLDVVNHRGATFMAHDMAFTLVDSLDTLFVMGLHDEFDSASAWMKSNLKERMIQPGALSFFETTIRSLGGLLSAYYLSGESHILELADTLGAALTQAFPTESPIPYKYIDLQSGFGYDSPCLSEASSFQLEFTFLAQATGKTEYLSYVKGVNEFTANMTRDLYIDGLITLQPQWSYSQASGGDRSFGALGDSYFEYLLKQWLLTRKRDDVLKQRYLQAVEGMAAKLVGYTEPSNLTFLGLLKPSGILERRMEHLTCFAPGMLALGTYHGLPQAHLKLAKELMETCVQMYLRSKSKLSPESVNFHPLGESSTVEKEFYVLSSQDYSLLRPETVESLMILYRVTKDVKYRYYGRTIMNAFETQAKVAGGGYRDTRNVFYGPIQSNGYNMETFFLAETLKYLFLLFSDDDILPLDAIVFNTEAHPLPVLEQ